VWLAVANSFAMDFLVRMKVSLKMALIILDSLPFPRLSLDDPRAKRLITDVLHLVCTGPEMNGLWNSMADSGLVRAVPASGPPPGCIDLDERQKAVARIEAEVAMLYGLTADDVAHILDTFPIVRKNDEKAHGEYRTKRVILEIYDAMAEVMRANGQLPVASGDKPLTTRYSPLASSSYQTRLDPPPADPRVAHPDTRGAKR
jgi:hypothetical protein